MRFSRALQFCGVWDCWQRFGGLRENDDALPLAARQQCRSPHVVRAYIFAEKRPYYMRASAFLFSKTFTIHAVFFHFIINHAFSDLQQVGGSGLIASRYFQRFGNHLTFQ